MNVELAPSFIRAYKKTVKHDQKKARRIKEKIELFRLNSKDPSLRAHKLSGYKKETWSFSIEYNLRILYTVDSDTFLLVYIGTHDEVY